MYIYVSLYVSREQVRITERCISLLVGCVAVVGNNNGNNNITVIKEYFQLDDRKNLAS